MADAPASCPVCDGAAVSRYAAKDGYVFWRCAACGLLFVWPRLSAPPEEIYQADYFGGAKAGFGYVDYDAEKSALDGLYLGFLERAARHLPKKGKLLDVGAATGHFVALAKGAGWDARGIDVSAHGADTARAKGLDVRQTTLDGYDAPAGSFDMLTMWDVIEHLPDPMAALKKAATLLRPGGLLAIVTPDARSAWARLWGTRWHALVPPEHIVMFNRAALSEALGRNGFEILEARNPVKSFKIPYILSTFARWTGIKIPPWLGGFFGGKPWSSFAVPLPLRDNVMVLARKVRG